MVIRTNGSIGNALHSNIESEVVIVQPRHSLPAINVDRTSIDCLERGLLNPRKNEVQSKVNRLLDR